MEHKHRALGLVVVGLVLAVGWLVVRIEFLGVPLAPPPPSQMPRGTPAPAPTPVPTSSGAPRLDAQVLERAKAATVFIQVRNVSYVDEKIVEESSGTGFFITPDGQVATCWHVIAAMKTVADVNVPLRTESIKVIVRSGKRDQRVLPARLLAADIAADLAILKVEAQDCPSLPLGRAGKLVETSPLWVLGFPLGRMFSVLQRGPELSLNGGTASSLRHDDLGRLQRIQFDAVVIRGNSGGPVITPRGEVVGVANIAFGTSRVNFAIPAEKLTALRKECPVGKSSGKDCRLTVGSKPPGADVYLDSRPIGKTPLDARAPGGYGRLVVTAPGHRSWARRLGVYDGRGVAADEVRLQPLPEIKLDARAVPMARASGGSAMKRGEAIFGEDFSDPKAADDWKQDTGGSDNDRTWYVEKGALHQFSPDGMLHAVFAEKQKLPDYSFSARVRISTNANDGRAGLIFRATSDGFALFRLHRGSNKVQLAYHVNQPFGWRVLDERSLLPLKVEGDRWYRMEVQACGDRVACLLDGKVVLEATVQQKAAGKVGFYSVDSRAAFDDAEVRKVTADGAKSGRPPVLRNFWFSDHFDRDCGYWRATSAGKPAPPWPMVPSGCLQLDVGATDSVNLLECYDIRDMVINSSLSCRTGTAGLVFRRKGNKHYLFAVEPAKRTAKLYLVDGDKRKELGKASPEAVARVLGAVARATIRGGIPVQRAALLADLLQLFVIVRGDRIRAGINNQLMIDARDRTVASGKVGLYTDKARAVFHSLDVAGPAPAP